MGYRNSGFTGLILNNSISTLLNLSTGGPLYNLSCLTKFIINRISFAYLFSTCFYSTPSFILLHFSGITFVHIFYTKRLIAAFWFVVIEPRPTKLNGNAFIVVLVVFFACIVVISGVAFTIYRSVIILPPSLTDDVITIYHAYIQPANFIFALIVIQFLFYFDKILFH